MDYGVLARSYNTLHYSQELRKVLSTFYREKDFNNFSKYQLHKKVNDALFKHYEGEEILKYKLAKDFFKKDYVAAFEVKVKNSRADFLAINGYTKCFEVKSKIDTLKRLEKQSKDYGDVFEFTTIVIDEKHLSQVERLLPDHYGIWYYIGNKKVIYRQPSLATNLNSEAQINLLTKKELKKFFLIDEITKILDLYSSFEINQLLKAALKDRYAQRWSFITDRWHEILPIDLQFFFNTNICPSLIYRD